jgi:hypothetical protein
MPDGPVTLLRRLLSAEYLYATSPWGGDPQVVPLAAWGLFWLGVLVAAWLWRGRLRHAARPAWAAHALAGLAMLGGLAIVVQAVGRGPLSARIWGLSAAALALAWPALYRLAQRPCHPWLQPVAGGLAAALAPGDPAPSWRWRGAWLLLHVAGLLLLILTGGIGAWLPLGAVACLVATATVRSGPRAEVLAPLLVAYGASLLSLVVEGIVGVDIARYRAFAHPDPWSIWFDGRTPVAIAAAWVLATTLAYLWRARPRPGPLLAGAGAVALGWWAALYGRHLSHGATASDPFCYLQMAADLATKGTPRHFFPLAGVAHAARVPVWPVAPVGYHPPLDGWSATVWPAGWSALLAPLYRLGGEALALWGAPLFLVAAAWLAYRLTRLALAHLAPQEALPGSLLAAGVMLTSYEAVTRSLVPMADAAVAALSAGALLTLLLARRSDRLGWSVAGGLALALAYHVRHPQLPLALAALPAYLMAPWPRRRRVQHLLVFAAAALVAALPDLAYHARAFGSPWVTESPEWFLLGPRYIGAAWARLWEDGLWRRNELGYLWPLVLLGVAAQARSRREQSDAWILLAGFAGVLLLHLCYAALRLRDLIGLFPWLALWTGRGAAALWGWARQGAQPTARRAAVLLLLLALLAARSMATLGLPLRPHVETFGYLSAEQRAGFEQLAALLPPQAVVGASLNAGAISRYSGRETVRPAVWTPDEFDRFVAALAATGRPLYLVADGEEIAAWLPTVAARYALTCQGSVALPLYGRGGQALEGQATLYLLAFLE